MKIKKILCASFSFFMLMTFSFAESASAEAEPQVVSETPESEETDPIWEGTKSAAKSVGGFFKKNAQKLDKKIQSNKKTACEGKWIFTNGEAETTILCNSDGTMNIRMDRGEDIRLWKGSFESTKNEISFHITAFNERINGKEKFDSLHSDDWKINYKVEDTVKMTLTSESMSEDLNGYRFVNSTVFLRVK